MGAPTPGFPCDLRSRDWAGRPLSSHLPHLAWLQFVWSQFACDSLGDALELLDERRVQLACWPLGSNVTAGSRAYSILKGFDNLKKRPIELQVLTTIQQNIFIPQLPLPAAQ